MDCSGEAPGYTMVTCIYGMSTSGYISIFIFPAAYSPPPINTIMISRIAAVFFILNRIIGRISLSLPTHK
ncbi:hypothetical protein D3C85_1431960 [compost metagenome]